MSTERLVRLETVIDTNQRNFYQIGGALKQIRDERLFRTLLYDRFETYVKERWDMARSQAYRLIEAAAVMENLSPIGDKILPKNESQARVLARYSKEDQQKIWQGFIHSGTNLTAGNLRKYAHDYRKKGASVKKPKLSGVDMISDGFKAAVTNLLMHIRLERNNGWESTSREAALFWLKVMKDTIIRLERS